MKTCTPFPQAFLVVIVAFMFISPSISQAARSLPRSDVPFSTAISDALHVAQQKPTWEVMVAKGDSMVPHYGDGSVLVVDALPFENLRPGMIAVFKDAAGDWVGHFIQARGAEGWITRGINNSRADAAELTESNYHGVIFGVLNSAGADAAGLALAQGHGIPTVIGKR